MPNYSQSLHSQPSLSLKAENDGHLSNTMLVVQTSQTSNLNQEPKAGFDEIAMIGVGLLFILSVFYLVLRKRQPNRVILAPVYKAEDMYVRNPGIPCRHCHYFHPNLHLQCAVHPDMVLKRQATQCKDFKCRNNKDVAA
ncbi:hypothetical protein [Leptolyngbya sp. FACHB-16]|uniref:hypothetical protein n=1 Tax=unclassified Leptolyngbya TaxID=2650499 RepID=UPI0016893206|nr:hypothetical protein [Leptolyngbya sp. FACHB-16]MBD2153690.1 hypothetical protein [Leptolyngbya sp. FACHB-16]